ncbi:proteasome subunit alpha type-7-b [Anaeramoeba ignava]|uniref:Proteasome subunit alpha type-7-b n=1 Tax=Anaeramoeba ignava TaxID=1746090 RepID=A0A9Q0RE98_ANAIG|nr:proteasome subunit alpha type-7-b [Anaeramoeba ignava]
MENQNFIKRIQNYKEVDEEEAVKLAVMALVEVVESGKKNIDIGVLRNGKQIEFLERNKIADLVKEIEAEKKKKEEDNF